MSDRDDLDRRLSEEIQFHIEQQIEKNLRAGMSEGDARKAAHLKFGGVESAREYTRDEFRFAWFHDFARDMRIALRMWKRSRGAAVVAILTLAIGIGANTAMFSLLSALVLRPLPYPDAERLVSIWDSSEKNPRNEVAFANYVDWKAQQTSFETMGLYRWWTANITDGGRPERVQGFQFTGDILAALGMKPELGRFFTPEESEPGKERVALLSHGLWVRRYGANPAVLGSTITINSVPRTIIGVLPREMNFPPGAEVIAPFSVSPEIASSRRYHSYYVVGRLKSGVTVADANAEIEAIAARLAREYPDSNLGLSARVFPLSEDVARSYSNGLWLLMASVGFVLLIACANIANLLLARAPSRAREIAVRTSMGAGRGRIVRQVVAESIALSLVGGILGTMVALVSVGTIRNAVPADLMATVPGLSTLAIDARVLVFALAVSLATGLLFGLIPALRTSQVDIAASLGSATRTLGVSSGQRMRNALVAAEVALALTLLGGAGFTMKAFARLASLDTGFDAANVLTMGVTLPYARYGASAQAGFFSTLLSGARDVPGVVEAGLISHVPLAPGNATDGVLFEGRPESERPPEADYRVASSGYFEAIGARMLQGRSFADSDSDQSVQVMIVNETFARRFFARENPVGRHVRFSGPIESNPWREIVGVVADLRHDLNQAPRPETYVPFTQGPMGTMFLVAKTRGDALGMAPSLRAAVLAIDPDQPVWAMRTLSEVKDRAMAGFRAMVAFVGAFGSIALLLSAIGIFGVVSFVVSMRTPEIGLRMALGASSANVVGMILRQACPPLAVGLAIGAAGAFTLGRTLSNAFPEVASADPSAFAATTLILAAVSALATWLPARRAAAIAPTEALRTE
jgi:putative ABC transport system permease protein